MGEVLTPPTYRELDGSLVFLAGPIQGAPDWQNDAIAFLKDIPGIHIASPRRSGWETLDYSEEVYNEQVAWEHFHLERAAQDGVILFWLARETIHSCDRAYAQTSRFELGEAVTLHRWKGVRVVVGIEADSRMGDTFAKRLLEKPLPSSSAPLSRKRALGLSRCFADSGAITP